MKKYHFIVVVFFALFLFSNAYGHEVTQEFQLPISLESYKSDVSDSVWMILKDRVKEYPFNLIATIIFLCAVVHTFLAYKFEHLAHRLQEKHQQMLNKDVSKSRPANAVCYKAEFMHFFGEVEAIFGIWIIPLAIAVIVFYDWGTLVNYLDHKVNYLEPFFVVVVMTIASTRPILKLADNCMRCISKIGGCRPTAWWFAILIVGPLLGSFITEPAAMTISALLLAQQFYDLKPSPRLAYATLGLLFVNISVGGTLTHFAAPPVLMVAGPWGWDMQHMFIHFGWKSLTGIIISTVLYYCIFKQDFQAIEAEKTKRQTRRREVIEDEKVREGKDFPIPFAVTVVHVLFMVWTIANMHHIPLFVGGFLFFLAFTQVTLHHQFQLRLRTPLLVGFFLTGLVIHGGLQQWWIQPILSSFSEVPLFIGATVLTAFNDNAAITYLAQLVPSFQDNAVLQHAVVAGAVAGGGLTVIANAPNPAGRSILVRFFEDGLSPLKLLLGALIPTLIVSLCLTLLP